jgi:BMFP domain-containing protein YqiC
VEALPGAAGRIETVVYQCWYSTSNVTSTQREQFDLGKVEYAQIRKKVDDLKMRIEELEKKMSLKGVPYTPNRPDWKRD